MKPPSTIAELINQCPPFLVVALARRANRSRKGMSTTDISRATGIPTRTLVRILSRYDWSGVRLTMIDRIFTACNIDIFRMARNREYVRETNSARTPFRHLSRQQRRTLYTRMQKWNTRTS